MIKRLILLIVISIAANGLSAQIPAGKCGILCNYDAAGNRIKREYVCNNAAPASIKKQEMNVAPDRSVFTEVNALYPNPTTGKFYIAFSTPLADASVMITDMNGRTIQTFKTKGQKLEVDISGQAAGMYLVSVVDGTFHITKKVIKH